MVVKSQLKFINSLQQKKYRTQHGLFVAEGVKLVSELLSSDFGVYGVYTTSPETLPSHEKIIQVSKVDLAKMSGLKTPNTVLGVFYIPEDSSTIPHNWSVALDDVRDPGNLGTIIRLCDWFNISQVVCSPNTVDCYNPKVLQASMGSIARVKIVYIDLEKFIADSKLSVYGAFMGGKPVYREKFPEKGILLMGNEGKGISQNLEALVHQKISIPQFGKKTTESLNVATATAILLNEIRRD
ncbi:TrmH family RNA methyltransferase [Costertonia aggregata]|uniref:RNA methyltransferase n=1 Tax=Costertonia aggregata TaxID=343403 RepID=A0A7H9AM43_9FLAO|nr:RNA methyltransferase [Costertonia aggregata]QLG44355.1 RNA methyltransferase [Costertonia aggregata]